MAILSIRNLSRRFGGLEALKRVSFDVEDESIVGIIGPNGAGKTTLFNIITGHLMPDAGRITFKNSSLVNLMPYQICKLGISRTFQTVRPFLNLSVLENVRTGAFNRTNSRKEATEMALEVCSFVELDKKLGIYYTALTLSEQKKLELARVLATTPQLVLLDELMGGLNACEVENMLELVRKIRDKHITVVLIEHIMKAIMSISDKVVVISFGEKIAEGIPREIARDPRVVEAYLGKEFFIADSGQTQRILP